MITFKDNPDSAENINKLLHPYVKEWFFKKFKDFSLPQKFGVMEVHSRNNILVSAVTGSGKTMTGFLAILNELIDSSEKGILEDRIYCIYISPLRALSRDIHHNLIEPLKEIEELAGKKFGIRIGIRTGDTSATEKAKMLIKSPHILITTPESLSLMLNSIKFIKNMKKIDWCIIDETHALAENKRGVHLNLSLERLQNLNPGMCRIGLSATIHPLDLVAQWLVGSGRSCKIIDARFDKKIDIKVISPVDDLINSSYDKISNETYNLIDKLIHEHKTTLIFTNTRSGTERVVHHLKDRFPKKYTEITESDPTGYSSLIGAHHGSLSKEHRFKMEDSLKQGKLKAVVCLEGNTKILNSKGEWIKIKYLEEDFVQSLNEKFKLNNNKIITKITKNNSENLVKIKTSLGKEILATKEHKFLTINKNGELFWKEAQYLCLEDFIATIRDYNCVYYNDLELKKLTFDNYPDNYFVQLNDIFLKKLRKQIISKFYSVKELWRHYFVNSCSYSIFRSNIKGTTSFKIKNLKKLIYILDLNYIEVFQNINTFSSDKILTKKLEITPELMRLLGFMCAEGYLSKYALFVSNRNQRVLNYYKNIIKNLSQRKSGEKIGSTGTPILIWQSAFLVQFLKSLGFKIGRKARILNIPSFIFRLNKNLLSEFISGYLDGDGFPEIKKSIDNRTYAVGFSTTSKEMAEDINRILIREGISSSIRSKYIDKVTQLLDGYEIKKKGWFYDIVILGGEHIRKFAEFVNPCRQNLQTIKSLKNLNGYCNRDVIPNLGILLKNQRKNNNISNYQLLKEGKSDMTKFELGNRNISRNKLNEFNNFFSSKNEFLNNLSQSDLFWEKLKSVKIAEPAEFIYNIEVENDHNYVANGFITKNCSTSLELGLDIGYIDLVICLGSPKSISRLVQRTGRSMHTIEGVTKARIIATERDDLVECCVMVKNAIERKIDRIHIPTNCLDVLAQQIIGMALDKVWEISELYELIKKSYCYKDLNFEDFNEVLDYLAGNFASLEERHVYARIWKNEGKIGKKGKLARVIYMTNLGTIPDESYIIVKIKDHVIGHIDENFLEKLKPGDIFVLGGNTYQFKFSRGMVAQVISAEGRKPTIPSWFSEMLPLSFDLAIDIQKFRYLIEDKFENKKSKKDILDFINGYLYLEGNASEAIYGYFYDQYKYLQIPSHKKIIVEHFIDEHGKYYILFHSLYGRRVNDVLSRALAFAIGKNQHRDVEVGINDNGFYVSCEKRINAIQAFKLIKSSQLRDVLNLALDKSEVLKRRFRHCAARAFMILRTYKGQTKHVGRQQVSSMLLLSAVRRIKEDFCILKEARREVLEDLMDIDNSTEVIKLIEEGKIKIIEFNTRIPSPFAFNLVLESYSDILKMEERQEFLRRMHDNVKAKISLQK